MSLWYKGVRCVFPAVFPGATESSSSSDDPVDTLKAQLQDFAQRLADGNEGGGEGREEIVLMMRRVTAL